MLLDQQFRQAVNWAIDREKVVDVAINGYATVGSTLIVPYSQYHWSRRPSSAFGYDPEKAKQILDEAGYKDVNGDGYRETKDGRSSSLRLYATTDAPENQTAAKLITGWMKDVGIKLEFQVVDAGALIDAQYNYEGDAYAPDWDMFIWYWTQDIDPQFMLGIYTPQQVEGWNDCLWTDPEYTELNDEQAQTIDPTERIPIVHACRRSSTTARLRDPRLPPPARGLRHRRLAGLGQRARRRGGGAGRLRPLQLQQHRHLPLRRAHGRRGGERRRLQHRAHRRASRSAVVVIVGVIVCPDASPPRRQWRCEA